MAVLFDIAAILRDAGLDAQPLYCERNGHYPATPHVFEDALYSTALDLKEFGYTPRSWWPFTALSVALNTLPGGRNRKIRLAPDDVVIVPELFLHLAVAALPDNPKIIFSQNSFGYLSSFERAVSAGYDTHRNVIGNFAISDSCIAAMEMVGAQNIFRVPVCPNFDLFRYTEEKKRKISYMPRKRAEEARLIDRTLRRRGNIKDYELVAIDGMSQARVAQELGESRFFISLMRREALGFPAMEAMASGAVVIGYTGFGTREYFDTGTGVPVAEDDTAGIVDQVERAVASYDEDPAPWEAIRQKANARIRERYAPEVFQNSLLRAMSTLGIS